MRHAIGPLQMRIIAALRTVGDAGATRRQLAMSLGIDYDRRKNKVICTAIVGLLHRKIVREAAGSTASERLIVLVAEAKPNAILEAEMRAQKERAAKGNK